MQHIRTATLLCNVAGPFVLIGNVLATRGVEVDVRAVGIVAITKVAGDVVAHLDRAAPLIESPLGLAVDVNPHGSRDRRSIDEVFDVEDARSVHHFGPRVYARGLGGWRTRSAGR